MSTNCNSSVSRSGTDLSLGLAVTTHTPLAGKVNVLDTLRHTPTHSKPGQLERHASRRFRRLSCYPAKYNISCDAQVDRSMQVTKPAPAKLDPTDAKRLLLLARSTLVKTVTGQDLPQPDPDSMSPRLLEHQACFATLRNRGALRGCVGNLVALKPLFEAVVDSVSGAARRDSRFPPVSADELESIRIELSLLTEPALLHCDSPAALLQSLQPHLHGVILRIGNSTSTFLPKVWDDLPEKEEFLARLCTKGGFETTAWRGDNASISVYEAEVLEEKFPLSQTLTVPSEIVPSL